MAGLGLLWPRGSGPILRRGQASGSEPGERASGQRRASEGALRDVMTLSIVQSVSPTETFKVDLVGDLRAGPTSPPPLPPTPMERRARAGSNTETRKAGKQHGSVSSRGKGLRHSPPLP